MSSSKIVVWPQFNVDDTGRAFVSRPGTESSFRHGRDLLASTAPEFQPLHSGAVSARPWLSADPKSKIAGV